jgi:hypothetical protein
MRKLMFNLRQKFEPFSTRYLVQLNWLCKAKSRLREDGPELCPFDINCQSRSNGRCFLSAIFDVERTVRIGEDNALIHGIRG